MGRQVVPRGWLLGQILRVHSDAQSKAAQSPRCWDSAFFEYGVRARALIIKELLIIKAAFERHKLCATCSLARVQCSPRTRRIVELFTGVDADGICKQQAWEFGHLPLKPALDRRSGAGVLSGKYDFPASGWSWTEAVAALARSVKARGALELPSEILQHPHVSAEH